MDLKKTYVISHGYAESGRLHLQQWLWKMQVGWDLHPAISLPSNGEICIADLGCGNGAWLLSLSAGFDEAHNERTVLSGFDISSVHFPASKNLPGNITLETMDAFTDALPENLIGKFHVVHVRVFSSVVKNDNPGPLITNAVKMLKPGGYLQWDEFDGDSFKAVPPNPSVSGAVTQEMLDTAVASSKNAMSFQYIWCSNLGSIFAQHGLEVLEDKRMDVKKELRKPMTDSLLMVFEHIAKLAVRNGSMVGTDKNWTDLWNETAVEVHNGVSITMDMLVCLGRKPA
jgi:SAM-dependent methyltransferase